MKPVRDSLSRRSSVFGAPAETAIIKDPRPIKDKQYIVACVQRLEQYLVDNQYEKPLSQQTLMCPPSKEFFYMLEFLMLRIDAAFAFKDPKKPEEETPALFKAIKYPFGMSSRSLHSIGTPHAWPSFLAALHWLVELLNYHENAQMYRQAVLEDDPNSPEALRNAFFEFVAKSYTAFMAFDESEAQLEAEFVRTLLDRNRERQETAARLQEHTQQIQEETVRLQEQDTRVSKLTESLENSESELERLKAEVQKIKESNRATEAKLAEVKSRGSAQRESVERLQVELITLDRVLREQEESGLDVDNLNMQRADLKQSIRTAMKRRDEVEQASKTIEMEISDKFREVERGVSQLNALMEAAGLNALLGGELRVQPQSHTNFLSMDMKSSVKPVLLAFLEEQRRTRQTNQPILVEMQSKADQKKEEVSQRRAALADLKAMLDRETAKFNAFKDSLLAPKKQLDAEILDLDKEIDAISLESKDLLGSRKRIYTEMVQRLEDKRQEYEKVERELTDQLSRYLEWILNHKQLVEEKLGSLASALEKQDCTPYERLGT